MAKKIVGFIKLQVPAGKANPSPPIGPALGQRGAQHHGVLQGVQCHDAENLRAGHANPGGDTTAYADRSLYLRQEEPAEQVIFSRRPRGSKRDRRQPERPRPVGRVTMDQIREIAEQKMQDLNAKDVEGACRMLVGSARSMGLEVVEQGYGEDRKRLKKGLRGY